MNRLVIWIPLAVFAAFLLIVAFGLGKPDDHAIRSKMIGKPVPAFALAPIVATHPGLSSADLKGGRPRLLNIFASWCGPCILEMPQLLALKRRGIPIEAIAIRDRGEDVATFLKSYGDPFDRIGSDPRTRAQIALGSSGVPETFLIDGSGVIRLQHLGDIRPEEVSDIIGAYEAAR